ncbi:MAG: amidohydrolase family protein [Propionibacteriaceae bacterium]
MSAGSLLLRDAAVWDGETDDLIRADVACTDGVITAIEPPGTLTPDRDAVVLDLDGEALLPGLIDGHVHLVWSSGTDPADDVERDGEQLTAVRSAENARAHLAAGVTTIADLGSNWDVAITVATAIERGLITGPTVLAAGRTVAMTGGHDPFWVNMCDGVDAVTRGVREQVFAGAGIIKTAATGGVYGRAHGEEVGASEMTAEELTALATETRRRGLQSTAHALGTEGIGNAVRAGVDVIQHGVFLTDEIVAEMVTRGTALSPTLSVYRTIAAGSAPGYAVAKAAEVVKAHDQSVRMAYAAGVPIIAGTDAGSPGMPHPSLAGELAALADVGLSGVDVLKAATSRAADALGATNRGRIRVGAVADLITVPGHPLADPTLATSPSRVIKSGRLTKGSLT